MKREEKKVLRGILFRHLDGIAVAPTVSALYDGGITEYILQHPHFHEWRPIQIPRGDE